jgi:nucleoside-diphosphate-sugar epimerase
VVMLIHQRAYFIYSSSSSVYGTQAEPVDERSATFPETDYAKSKLLAEYPVTLASEANPFFNGIVLRFATMCGPAPRMRLDTIVNVFCKQAFFDGVITVWDGTQYRTNVNVQDATDVIQRLLEISPKATRGQIFNVSTEFGTAVEIANLVSDAYGAYTGTICEVDVDRTKTDTRQYRMRSDLIWRVTGLERRSIEDACMANFDHFASGAIEDPNADLYYNTRRMERVVKEDKGVQVLSVSQTGTRG